MIIKKLPVLERPYEKAQMYGIENLSNAELLAIIIKTGTKEKTSIELAQEILSIETNGKENIQFLQDVTIQDLTKIKGVGTVKAIQIKAVCELNKRMARPINKEIIKIGRPYDVYQLLTNEMRYEKREKLKVLALNTRNILLKIIDVSQGGTSSIAIDLKDILSEPIKIGAAKIILVHNHPAGSTIPSQPDIQLTQKLYNVAYQLGIEFIDHIIIAKDKYESIFRMAKIGE
ncbi:MAG: DNA repair protein RadC [Clostridia bacterium]